MDTCISYPIVKLYKDDLYKLFELLSNYCNNLSIIFKQYEYHDLNELYKISQTQINELKLLGFWHKDNICYEIKLEFGSLFTSLSFSNIDELTKIIIKKKLDEILLRRKKALNNIFNDKLFYIILGIPTIIAFINDIFLKNKLDNHYWYPIMIYFSVLYLTLYYGLRSYKNTLNIKHNYSSNYFRRNGENIVTGIFCGIISGVIVYLMTIAMKIIVP